MRRTTLTLFLLLALAIGAVGAAASARSTSRVPRLIFPVIGRVQYSDDFGAPRAGGSHQGNDILARRQASVVAVEAGRVEKWTSSPSAGCMLYLYGSSGTMYEYIHLNNDLTDGNDNRGSCVNRVAYAPGLHNGKRVKAGQLIGYVGDSGDANGLHPHLHFELHPHGGAAVSPYRWLRRARHLKAPATTEPEYPPFKPT
jgi:murein DD-endopeptidase MepM/ murein hydrolase activator NlpD